MMKSIDSLHRLGQSLWYDNIQRRLLENGALAKMIADGDIRGVTSNPTIFHKAIASSNDYDSALKPLAAAGLNAEVIFWELAVEDIQAAADLFRPLYDQTKGGDGYVSLEVNPYLAHDSEKTLSEAKRLWAKVARPNLMVKIPATVEGLSAIRDAIAAGININVTLIFSLDRYEKVMDAYMSGLEKRLANGLTINHIASVASFFVSRLDNKIDPILQAIIAASTGQAEKAKADVAATIMGKSAIANTRLAYALFQKIFGSKRYEHLKQKGANYQRPLWASTSTKNPAYRDVMYIEDLIAPHTVNTVPPQTLDAFRDHGIAKLGIEGQISNAQQVMDELKSLGISIESVTGELEVEGVKSFSDAFTALLKSIEDRRKQVHA
jgi:transaldolase